jgi:hypothetical protein
MGNLYSTLFSTASFVKLRPPFFIPHTFRDDIAASKDGSDTLLFVSPANMAEVVTNLANLGWNIPQGASELIFFTVLAGNDVKCFLDTISIVGVGASIAPGLTLVRSIKGPVGITAPQHTRDAVWVYDPSKDRHRALDEYCSALAETTDGLPYPCRRCRTINRPMYKKDIYVVVKGFEVGIFQGLVRRTLVCFLPRQLIDISLQAAASNAVRLPGQDQDAPGTKKYVVRTLDEANDKWQEACLIGEVAKLDAGAGVSI